MKKALLLVVLLVVLSGCASGASEAAVATAIHLTEEARPTATDTPEPTYTPRPTHTPTSEPVYCGEAYDESISPILQRWDDAFDIANSTGRGNLSGPIGTLQEVRRDAAQLDIPDCASEAHDTLLLAMERTIEGFLLFMRQESDSRVNSMFDSADRAFEGWLSSIEELYETPLE